jgi:hypothetical protein
MPKPKLLPPDKYLDCRCDWTLTRMVLIPEGDSLQVAACVGCGRLTVTESIVNTTFGRDVQAIGNLVLKQAAPVVAWLGAWPRRSGFPSGFYLPAGTRAKTGDELLALEAKVAEEQKTESLTERLRQAGPPATPPPAELPRGLSQFADAWRGLQLTADSPFDTLMKELSPWWASIFALPLLRHRPGFVREVVAWLEDPNEKRRELARGAVREAQLTDRKVQAAIRRRLDDDTTSPLEIHSLGSLVADLGATAPFFARSLRSWARRLTRGRYNYCNFVIAQNLREDADRCDPPAKPARGRRKSESGSTKRKRRS